MAADLFLPACTEPGVRGFPPIDPGEPVPDDPGEFVAGQSRHGAARSDRAGPRTGIAWQRPRAGVALPAHAPRAGPLDRLVEAYFFGGIDNSSFSRLFGSFCPVEVLDERVAKLDELGRHRVTTARPRFEHVEQDVSLARAKIYESGGADRIEAMPKIRRFHVLHPSQQGLARVPGEGHLAFAERDRDSV